MSDIPNPPAFPNIGNSACSMMPTEGMTLRDWFAGQAFAAAMGQAEDIGEVDAPTRAALFEQVAGIIYEAADAMLRARQGGTE